MNSVLLIVLDGFGIASPGPGNASYLAHPESINGFLRTFPNTQLKASGEAVGLPAHEVGNTEVGHINMGAGKIIYQSLPRINLSIADQSFYKNTAFLESVSHIKQTGGNLHLIGLIGGGSVHASVSHLYALLYFCKENNVKNVYIHAITDGRDSPPKAAKTYLSELQDKIDSLKVGAIATVMGRYYAMDRDKRWERIEKAYKCLVSQEGAKASSWQEAVDISYKNGKNDEFVDPTIITSSYVPVREGDSMIFFNFRIDRPRELTKAFVLDNFEQQANTTSYDPFATKYHKSHLSKEEAGSQVFNRGPKLKNLHFVTMTEYEDNLPVTIAYPRHIVKVPLGRIISDFGVPQLRMAESEKERFVTYYFNGLRELKFPNEDRIIIPSPKVPTYDQKPEMSAPELTNELIKQLPSQKYKFILINFANADMVGHTGNLDASIKAVQTLDTCLGKIAHYALLYNYTVLITADHGNVEQKINPETGGISTEHTANPVPFIALSTKLQGKPVKLQTGILADIAPTILSLMGIPKPADMTGRNLLEDVLF
jgi:2,3-bisphosphoglycerate-independent phosphoglycerate mutase